MKIVKTFYPSKRLRKYIQLLLFSCITSLFLSLSFLVDLPPNAKLYWVESRHFFTAIINGYIQVISDVLFIMQVKLGARLTVCTCVHLAYQDLPTHQTSFGRIGRLRSRGFQSGFAKKTTFTIQHFLTRNYFHC